MGLARAFRRRDEEPEKRGWQSWWNLAGAPGFISAQAYYGGSASVEQALRNAGSSACMDVLADAIGRTPWDVFRGEGASRLPVMPQPSIVAAPSGLVAVDVWRYQLGFSLVTDGNAFGRIMQFDRRGYPTQVELIDPTTVTARKTADGMSQVTIDQETHKLYPFGDILHVPGRMVPAGSVFALSPVIYANRVIGTSLSAEDFSFKFFDDGGHPSSIIYSDEELTAEQAAAVKSAWRRATTGNREVAVLGAHLKHEQVQINPSDSQFLDLMRFEVEQACRFWRVPPVMVYASISGQNVTYANVTDSDINFLKHSLDGYYVRVETAMSDLLPRPQIVKVNRNAILRADVKTRYEVYQTAIRNGLKNRDECRTLEDEPPIPDGTGDQFLWPPVGQGAGQDVRPPAGGGVVNEQPGGATVTPA